MQLSLVLSTSMLHPGRMLGSVAGDELAGPRYCALQPVSRIDVLFPLAACNASRLLLPAPPVPPLVVAVAPPAIQI